MRIYEVTMVGDDYKVLVAAEERDEAKKLGYKAFKEEGIAVNYFDIRAKIADFEIDEMPENQCVLTQVFVNYDEVEVKSEDDDEDDDEDDEDDEDEDECCCDDCEDCCDEDFDEDLEEEKPEERVVASGIDVVDLASKITAELSGKDLSYLKDGDYLEVGGYRFMVAGVKPELFPGQVAVAVMVDTENK